MPLRVTEPYLETISSRGLNTVDSLKYLCAPGSLVYRFGIFKFHHAADPRSPTILLYNTEFLRCLINTSKAVY